MNHPVLGLCLALALAGCNSSRHTGGGIRKTDAGTITRDDGGTIVLDSGVRADAGTPPCSTTGPENTAATCVDGCDNDQNGAADCDNPSCCALRTCPANTACGRPDAGGPPACATVAPEDSPGACNDGCDNDQNGFADCNDFSCCDSRTDCAPGTSCGDVVPMCSEYRAENTLGRCTNGCDDDPPASGQSFADCGDRSCCLVRQAGGQPCPSGTYCADQFVARTQLCAGDDVTQEARREATLGTCANGCDDDRNGFDDCEDRNCCAIRIAGGFPCATGTYCADTWQPGEAVLCPGDDVNQDPGTETDLAACSDGCDNDRNGFQDCGDRNCCAARTDCPLGTFCNP